MFIAVNYFRLCLAEFKNVCFFFLPSIFIFMSCVVVILDLADLIKEYEACVSKKIKCEDVRGVCFSYNNFRHRD